MPESFSLVWANLQAPAHPSRHFHSIHDLCSMAKKQESNPPEQAFVNPIDKDKVAENPGLLPYAHTAGGAVKATSRS